MKTCSITYFLNILAWMVRESVQLFLCLHWYSPHHLSSKGFPNSKKRKKGKIIEIKKKKNNNPYKPQSKNKTNAGPCCATLKKGRNLAGV